MLRKGDELSRATDCYYKRCVLFIITVKYNNTYTDSSFNTKYQNRYKGESKNGGSYSDYSRIVKAITPETIVYVNFNVAVDNAPEPWNNLEKCADVYFYKPYFD